MKAIDEKIKFIKQFPSHPPNRLQRINKKLKHPKNRMKNIEGQTATDNVSKLMIGEFDFNPERLLNKILIFDTKKRIEEIITDMMIDALNDKRNDEFYIEHPVGSNYFTLKGEHGRQENNTKSKKYFHEPKNRSKLFSEEKWKKLNYVKDSLFLKLTLTINFKMKIKYQQGLILLKKGK